MITLIACLDINDGIGDYEGNLLFNIKEDMKHFRSTTNGKTVVFGRKTVESLPKKKPLPNRRNIMLTRDKNNSIKGFETVDNIEYILELSKNEEVFICGGGEIYELFMPYADKMVLTHVHGINMNATTFFPDYNQKEWKPESVEKHESKSKKHPSFSFATYIKKD